MMWCLHYPGAHFNHTAVKERKGKVGWTKHDSQLPTAFVGYRDLCENIIYPFLWASRSTILKTVYLYTQVPLTIVCTSV